MVSQPGNNSRSALDPMNATFGDVERETQALMMGAEVVYAANQKHTPMQGFRRTGQSASTTGEGSKALTEGSIEALNVSGVNQAAIAIFRYQTRPRAASSSIVLGHLVVQVDSLIYSVPHFLVGNHASQRLH